MAKYRLARGSLLCCTLLALSLYLILSPRSASSNSRFSTTGRASNGKVTVLLSAYRTTGLRPQWIHDTAALYTSSPFHDIVDRVILVWNEPSAPPPRMPRRVQVIKSKVNSLNNRYVRHLSLPYALAHPCFGSRRWILSLPFIRTEAVLVLDDDIAISLVCQLRYHSCAELSLTLPFPSYVCRALRHPTPHRFRMHLDRRRRSSPTILPQPQCRTQPALTCLLLGHLKHPDRLLGPFARRRDPQTNEYILNELLTLPGEGSRYSMILPRVMMLSVGFLAAYGEQEVGMSALRKYVDEQEVGQSRFFLAKWPKKSEGNGCPCDPEELSRYTSLRAAHVLATTHRHALLLRLTLQLTLTTILSSFTPSLLFRFSPRLSLTAPTGSLR